MSHTELAAINQHELTAMSAPTAEQALMSSLDLQNKEVLLRKAALSGNTASNKLEQLAEAFRPSLPKLPSTRAVLHTTPASDSHPGAMYRLAGDRWDLHSDAALCLSSFIIMILC